jgi:hypothetical protein
MWLNQIGEGHQKPLSFPALPRYIGFDMCERRGDSLKAEPR